jgi:hypothetical protein
MNASIADLLEWSKNNPHRSHTLSPIEMKVESHTETQNSLANLCLPEFTATSLEPSGLLSACSWISDSTYALTHIQGRPKLIRELATKLQESSDNLKGSSISRKRTKIHNLIGAVSNQAQLKDEEVELFWQGISHIQNIQIILIKSTNIFEASSTELKGEILFSTSPHTWNNTRPIWIVDFYGNWIATTIATATQPFSRQLSNWLQEVETTGWIVQWPECDGKKEDIISQLVQMSSTASMPSAPSAPSMEWKTSDAKLKKEVLAKRLGKALSLTTFDAWKHNNFDEA